MHEIVILKNGYSSVYKSFSEIALLSKCSDPCLAEQMPGQLQTHSDGISNSVWQVARTRIIQFQCPDTMRHDPRDNYPMTITEGSSLGRDVKLTSSIE